MQQRRASRFAPKQIGCQPRLAPLADLYVRHSARLVKIAYDFFALVLVITACSHRDKQLSYSCWWHNSFGVEARGRRLPRVARCSRPWALLHNPFGIEGDDAFRGKLTQS